MRALVVSACLSLTLGLLLVGHAHAQDERGCCQFFTQPTGSSPRTAERRCENLTRRECSVLKPTSTFFRGMRCDFARRRCVHEIPTATATATRTATPTPTITATRTPTPDPQGCCQLNDLRGVRFPVCGVAIPRSQCLNDFAGQASFCPDCLCSSHTSPGFDVAAGGCVTRTPTLTPTITATPTPDVGCCQVNSRLRGRAPICGNAISRDRCLEDFGGESTFCPECTCSSHRGSGFQLLPGECVNPGTPAPHPRPPHRPRAPHRPSRG